MTDRMLVHYIREALLEGHKLGDIKQHLAEHGHSRKQIDAAIHQAHKLFEKNKTSNKKGTIFF